MFESQIFLLTELFFISSICLLHVDSPDNRLLFLINFKNFVCKKRSRRTTFLVLNVATLLLNIFLPASPGPMLLGDFLVCVNLLALLFRFLLKFRTPESRDAISDSNTLRNITITIAVLHFIFPGLVLL